MELQIQDLKARDQTLESNISDLEQKINQNKDLITAQDKKFDDSALQNLEDQQTIVLTRINKLQGEVNELRNLVTTKDDEIAKLKQEKGDYQKYVYGIGAIALLGLLLSSGGN